MILGRHATNLRSQEGRQLNDSTRPSVFATIRDRLRDPAVLVIIAVVFLISTVGQAILQAWVGDKLSRDHRRIERPRIGVSGCGDHCRLPTRPLSKPSGITW